MPLRTTIECPECEADLAVKRGGSFPADTNLSVVYLQGLRAGACPNCGARISEHVARVRRREHRIEQVVAIVGTALVLGLYLATSAASLLEGVAAYAREGGAVLSRPAPFFGFRLQLSRLALGRTPGVGEVLDRLQESAAAFLRGFRKG